MVTYFFFLFWELNLLFAAYRIQIWIILGVTFGSDSCCCWWSRVSLRLHIEWNIRRLENFTLIFIFNWWFLRPLTSLYARWSFSFCRNNRFCFLKCRLIYRLITLNYNLFIIFSRLTLRIQTLPLLWGFTRRAKRWLLTRWNGSKMVYNRIWIIGFLGHAIADFWFLKESFHFGLHLFLS